MVSTCVKNMSTNCFKKLCQQMPSQCNFLWNGCMAIGIFHFQQYCQLDFYFDIFQSLSSVAPPTQITSPQLELHNRRFLSKHLILQTSFSILNGNSNSPKTITKVILMVFTFAFGINPRELALRQSGSFSRAIFLLRASVNGTEC